MGAVAALGRSELRRSWRTVVVVGLVAGLAGGAVLAALAGARRTDTAFDRLVERTHFWDIQLTVFDPGPGVIDRVLEVPGVAEGAVSHFSVGRNLRSDNGVAFIPVQHSADPLMVDRMIVAGRPPNPDAAEEIVVAERVAASAGMRIGDELHWGPLTHEQFVHIDEFGDAPTTGPPIALRVVGFTLDPSDVAFAETPTIIGTPAFSARFADVVPLLQEVHLRVDPGADPRAVAAEAAEIIEAGSPGTEGGPFPPVATQLLVDARGDFAEATDLPENVLLVVAAVIAAVAVFALLQTAARQFGAARDASSGVRALGVTSTQRSIALAAAALPAAVLAAVAAYAVAVAASPWTPIGAARRAEPDPGVFVDGWIVGIGAPAVGLVVALVFTVTAFAAGRGPVPRGVFARNRPRLTPSWFGLHPVVGLGSRLAADGGGVVPVRSAMVGVALGTVTVCGSLVFGASLDRVQEPSRYGHPDLSVEAPDDTLLARMQDHDDVDAATLVQTAEVEVGGISTGAFGFGPLDGELGFSLLDGRHPATGAEVVLGPRLLERLGLDVGDIVELRPREGGPEIPFRVVGSGLGPGDLFGSFADLAAFTTDGLDAVRQTAPFSSLHLDLSDGTSASDLDAELVGYERNGPEAPSAVTNLAALDRIPAVFVALGVLVALTAVGHTTSLTVRYRNRELATARALGCTAVQARAAVVFAAAIISGVGGAVGVPVGLRVGRRLWEVAANSAFVSTDWAVSPWVILVVPVTLAGAGVIALARTARSAGAPSAELRT